MYVIFPADEVVSLTYGRIIIPNAIKRNNPTSNPRHQQSNASQQAHAFDDNQTKNERQQSNPGRELHAFNGYDNNQPPNANRELLLDNNQTNKHCCQTSAGSSRSTSTSAPSTTVTFKLFDNCSINDYYTASETNYDGRSIASSSSSLSICKSIAAAQNSAKQHLSVTSVLDARSDKRHKKKKKQRKCKAPVIIPSIVLPDLEPDPRLQLTALQHGVGSAWTPDTKRKTLFGLTRAPAKRNRASPSPSPSPASSIFRMASSSNDSTLKELTHPNFNEALKSHNTVTFKLVRTVSDFTQQLSQIYEQHAEELQLLVSNFRKRNGELRKERPACPSSLFHTWETLLQEVEIDSQAHSDIASILGRQVSRPLLEKSFHRKIQSRKVFTHRESYETIIAKTEEKLAKCRQDYKNAYVNYLSVPTTQSLSAYFDTHNAYIQQLHATNGMIDEYGKETLPQLLQELEEIYSDLCSTLSEAVLQGAEVVSARAMEQYKRYEGLSSQCKAVSGPTDLMHFARSLPTVPANRAVMKRIFAPPQPPQPDPDAQDPEKGNDIQNENIPPPLKNELVVDRLAAIQVKPSHDALKKEALDLEVQIKQIQDALDTLIRIQQRSLESNLFNKVNELQEDISMKRFDLRVAQIHLSAINHQKELFSSKLDMGSDSGRERKMSSASAGSMKSKWLKAFKSLKTPPTSGNTTPRETEKKNGAASSGRDIINRGESDAHNFQEYTYKKITPCDVCSQVLRGHTRQGLKCRVCKTNVHVDCQDKVAKCQSKSRLLRRQKSTSEIETKIPLDTNADDESPEDINYGMPTMNRQLSFKGSSRALTSDLIESPEVDLIYQVLKQAGEISNTKSRTSSDASSGSGMPPPAPPVGILVVNDGTGSAAGSSGSSGHSLNRLNRGQLIANATNTTTTKANSSNLTVCNPVPISTSSERRTMVGSGNVVVATPTSNSSDGSMRRRLFAGMKSLTGFGSRSRHGSPHNRSISLPESARMKRSRSAMTLVQQWKSNGNDSFGGAGAPHSPRRQKLNLRMKSLSLDSPESTEHVQRRRHVGTATTSEPQSNNSSSSRIQSPSSPVHNRRLLSARNMRMSSVELPDDNEKSLSSASTSPCPSPVGGKKSHRLLPTNLYVILYNFKARHQDELDLKAGYKVTVIDTSDPDWWKGKCLGRVGYFPSKYCSKLAAGEKPLQVTHNLQVSDGDNGLMLLRDQIVIQVGEELDGMVMIRSGDNRQGVCPLKFLQEV